MLRRFLRAWRFTRDLRYNELAGELPWTLDDQENLNRFVLSPTGVKWRGRLANLAITKALEAVAVPQDSLYRAGTAYGIQITNLYIDQHLPSQEEETEESLNGELSGIYG